MCRHFRMIFPWVLNCMSASLFIVDFLTEIRPIMAYLQSSGKLSVILNKDIEKELDYQKLRNEPFEMKKYFSELNLPDARLKFSLDTQMLRGIKIHFSSEPKFEEKLWTCYSLSKKIEHKAYQNLPIFAKEREIGAFAM